MRKSVLSAAVVAVLALPLPAGGGPADPRHHSDEGCEAQNPLQPSCSFTVTHTSSTPITGAGGIGDWVVKVRRGSQMLTYRSLPDGRPTVLEIAYKIGDKVTAKALSPGSGLTAGHFDP